jgi:serine/threonine-protein kinase
MNHDISSPPDAPTDLDEIIAAYVEAVDAGQVGDRQEWLRRYPEAAAALTDFFNDQDGFAEKIAPLRQCLSGDAALESGPLPAVGTRVGNYELLGEIARGGMGVVFKARQVDLNRTVALKMIRRGAMSSAAEQQRFRQEAEAVAKLDHPHIVPIYEIGSWQNQPYFSMRFIEGGNLAHRIAASKSLLADAKTFPRAAAEFMVKVARAVHFAHQRGILHRDLKPANILLQTDSAAPGNLSEAAPFVTDFGLAKWLEESNAAEANVRLATCETARNLDGDLDRTAVFPESLGHSTPRLTQTGIAVGTPSYMAPEQIPHPSIGTGQTTATDVYSLGAVLYELIAGEPPFRAGTVSETLQLVVLRPVTPPHLLNEKVPLDLEMICLKCLEKDPARRYGSAEALAADLERFVQGEPIEARPLGLISRSWRWCRRQPALAAACILAFLALVSVAVVSALFAISEFRSRTALKKVADDLEISLAEQSKLAGERQTALLDAQRQSSLAEEHYHKAHKAVEDFYVRFSQAGLSKVPGLQPLQKEMLTTALAYFQDFLKQKGADPSLRLDVAKTCVRIGDINGLLGAKNDALSYYARAIEVTEQLVREDAANMEARRWRALAYLNRGVVLVGVGRQADALQSDEKAAELYRALVRDNPRDPEVRQHLASLLSNMGDLHRILRHFDKAKLCLQEAQLTLQPLLKRNSKQADYQVIQANILVNLGSIEQVLENKEESYKCFDQARLIYDDLTKRYPTDRRYLHMQALNNRRLAIPLNNRGLVKEGLPLLEKSRATLEMLVQENPGVPEYLVDWAGIVRALGDFHRGRKAYDKALDCYQEIQLRLEDPSVRFKAVGSFQNERAQAYYAIATIQLKHKDTANALKNVDRSLAIRRQRIEEPISFSDRQELGVGLVLRGEVLAESGNLDAGVQSIREGIVLTGKNADAAPLVPIYAHSLHDQYKLLVRVQKDKNPTDALRSWQQAQDHLAKLAGNHPEIPSLRRRLARILVDYGFDLRTQKRLEESRDRLGQAVAELERLLPDDRKETLAELAHGHFQLALTLKLLKKSDLEIAHYEKACILQKELVDLDQKPQAHSSLGTYLNNLGLTYKRQKDLDKAESTLRLAISHQSRALESNRHWLGARQQLSDHFMNLAIVLRAKGKLAEAVDVTLQRQELWTDKPQELFEVARDLGYCANDLARTKKKLTPTEQAELVRVADLSVEALRRAVAAGYADWAEVNRHAAFTVARTRPGFQQLAKEQWK